MASTTFSGPVTSTNGFVGNITGDVTGSVTGAVYSNYTITPGQTGLAAALGAVGNALNTSGKVIGRTLVDLDDGLIYVATGTAAADPWKASDGTTSITPV